MSGVTAQGAAVQSPDYSLAQKKRTKAFDSGQDRNSVKLDPGDEIPFPPRDHLSIQHRRRHPDLLCLCPMALLNAMNTHPMKLVTVVCEALAREPLEALLLEVGANGYTLFTVEGRGAKGARVADIHEFANIQVEVIVQPGVACELLARLEKEFFPRYAMIAYENEVRVLRKDKF